MAQYFTAVTDINIICVRIYVWIGGGRGGNAVHFAIAMFVVGWFWQIAS